MPFKLWIVSEILHLQVTEGRMKLFNNTEQCTVPLSIIIFVFSNMRRASSQYQFYLILSSLFIHQ